MSEAITFIYPEVDLTSYFKRYIKIKELTPLLDIFAPEGLPKWNDAPERTFEEVLAKCKELGI